MTARGLRNNNPTNLRPSGDDWKGLRVPQTDPGYLQFITNFYGLRAGAKNLLTYYRKHGRRTVHDIIWNWAPPSDNNPTSDYIQHVARDLGVDPHDKIHLENGNNLRALMESMIRVECGSQPFSKQELEEAINAAYASHSAPPVNEEGASQVKVYPTEPKPESSTVPVPQPAVRDQIVPPEIIPTTPVNNTSSSVPPLVDQPSPVPTRKVVLGGAAGAVAFIVMAVWNRLFPSMPIPAEYAAEIAGLVILASTLVTQYFVRNRATDIPPAPAESSSKVGPMDGAK